ncbi:MAG: pantoate--beta-alanine ligase [Kiritimatiellae bacterium]|nr:pantoate--beta-alanine ligase [Kiritimatiellia bacterium]
MKKFFDPIKLQKWSNEQRLAGKKIALVPTMGALHDGHISLIKAAKKKGADEIIVSIFVNPVQFGPNEDYDAYPRTEKEDAKKCSEAGATAIFFPTPQNMYLENHSVYVNEEILSSGFCGAKRPGHFRGVCTVVAKLFNITHPHIAVFGQKDFQQAAVICQMVRDLNFDTKIIIAPIVREKSGLAMSSRNNYLSPEEREKALCLSKSLQCAKTIIAEKKEISWKSLKTKISAIIEKAGLKVDYVEAANAKTLTPLMKVKKGDVILLAAFCGKTRLIDNAIM